LSGPEPDRAAGRSGDAPVVVGRIGGAYGVKGWVRLSSYTEPPENLLDYRPWLLAEGLGWRPLEVLGVRPHQGGFVAKLADVDDREQAAGLRGRLLAVPAAVLPEPAEDEFYWRDLIGLEARSPAGERLGRVVSLLETGHRDVLVIERPAAGERDWLVPFDRRYVPEVRVAEGYLCVDWDPAWEGD